MEYQQIAAELQTSKPTVILWRKRFAESRFAGIERDQIRPERPRKDRAKIEKEIIELTTQTTPPNATHWSTRMLAEKLGVDHVFVHRVCFRLVDTQLNTTGAVLHV